jgi:type IV pilus assembly protein PilV
MMRLSLNRREGYTLVELLITILFFAIGMLAMYRLQLAVIQSNARAGQLNRATAVAEAKMEALLALDYDSLTSADTPQAVGSWTVLWTVTSNQPVSDTKTVRVTVSWADRKNEPHHLYLDSIKGN